MTIQEKKQVLKKYGQIDDRIEQLRRYKEDSRLCEKYHTTEFEEKIKSKNNKGSIVEITVEKRAEDWDLLIKNELDCLYDLRIKIENAINKLTDFTQQKLLRLLYLGDINRYGERSRFTVSEISQMLNYSERQIYRIYKKALINLPDINYVSECQ